MTTFQEAAKAFNEMLIRDTRSDGTNFYRLHGDTPEWMRDACRDAHDGEAPNDWRYDMIDSLLDSITDHDDPDDIDTSEIADSFVPAYNAERVSWLSDNLSREDYCNRAVEEYGQTGHSIFDAVGQGMYLCIREMADALVQAIREEAGE